MRLSLFSSKQCIIKQLLDSVFVISGIIKVSVSVISLSLRLRLITLTSTLIIPDNTKTSSNNCLISWSQKPHPIYITINVSYPIIYISQCRQTAKFLVDDHDHFLLQLFYIWDRSLLLITKLKTCIYNLSLLVIFQLLNTSLIPSDYPCIK